MTSTNSAIGYASAINWSSTDSSNDCNYSYLTRLNTSNKLLEDMLKYFDNDYDSSDDVLTRINNSNNEINVNFKKLLTNINDVNNFNNAFINISNIINLRENSDIILNDNSNFNDILNNIKNSTLNFQKSIKKSVLIMEKNIKDVSSTISEYNKISKLKNEFEKEFIRIKKDVFLDDDCKKKKNIIKDLYDERINDLNLENKIKKLKDSALNCNLLYTFLKTVEMLNIKSGPKCSICFLENTLVCFKPCGHTCCTKCKSQLNICHLCRQVIKECQIIYFS